MLLPSWTVVFLTLALWGDCPWLHQGLACCRPSDTHKNILPKTHRSQKVIAFKRKVIFHLAKLPFLGSNVCFVGHTACIAYCILEMDWMHFSDWFVRDFNNCFSRHLLGQMCQSRADPLFKTIFQCLDCYPNGEPLSPNQGLEFVWWNACGGWEAWQWLVAAVLG